MMVHALNWYAGWIMVLVGFTTGAALGLFFHRDSFLGGYASFRRRVIRLGHIALVALGMLNVLYSVCPSPATTPAREASFCFVLGGALMPAVCFLTGWRRGCRWLFPLPVAALVLAVALTLIGGTP
jgi:hypothetical protein